MNISSIKTSNADSPKTPGGISKSLLTPCRRVGLSRKWKKSGVSPFVSPLSSADSIKKEVKQDSEIRKRKKCTTEVDENDKDSNEEISSELCSTPKIQIDRTPTRALLPRKKSKTHITAQKCQAVLEKVHQCLSELSDKNILIDDVNELQQDSTEEVGTGSNLINIDENMEKELNKQVTKLTKLSRKNPKSSNNILGSPVKNAKEPNVNEPLSKYSDDNMNLENTKNEISQNTDNIKLSTKNTSPNNLTKECIVVIQKKIFKTDKHTNNLSKNSTKENVSINKSASQTLFDSDSDDVPLSNLNTKPAVTTNKETKNVLEKKIQNPKDTNIPIKEKNQDTIQVNEAVKQNPQNDKIDITCKDLDDSDFVENKKANINKFEITSSAKLKNKAKEKPKSTKLQLKSAPKTSEQSSNLIDEDDDFDYSRSRTILIKKTYDKVTKVSKAKSTGSITQKDLDDIAARIESKKNLLLAKAMTNETKELRELIKKWQVGCQTALTELLDLMRKKLPDQNMEQSEMLRMLKIPPHLVCYDSDSDSFNTPDDAAIILSALKLNN